MQIEDRMKDKFYYVVKKTGERLSPVVILF